MNRRHVIWDWNGTLLDDAGARLIAVNESLAALGLPPIDMERYRAAYCVPVPLFYSKIVGRPLTTDEWTLADDTYQHSYAQHLPQHQRLTEGARQVMLSWIARGGTQSLLSLHTHTRLLADVAHHGIGTLFRLTQGRTGPTGGTKAEAMRRHIRTLALPTSALVAIGDAADDALAAQEAGIPVVLFSGGSHSPASLTATGVPVVDTLQEAIAVASQLTGSPQEMDRGTPARGTVPVAA